MTQEAANFELTINVRAEGGYVAELRFIPPGADADVVPRESSTPFDLDRHALAACGADDEAYGITLARFLFGDGTSPIFYAFREALATAQTAGVPLQMRIVLGHRATDLHDVQWERMRHPIDGGPLFAGPQIGFSRYLESYDIRPARPRPRGDLRALVVIASPADAPDNGLAPLDVGAERALAEQALAPLVAQSTVLCDPGSLDLTTITRHLREGYDLVYLMAHGALAEPRHTRLAHGGRKVAHLFLEDGGPGRAGAWVPAQRLVDTLRSSTAPPRLVVLASCESGGDGAAAVSTALGRELAQAGVPAVVAMQGQLTLATARLLLPAFFRALDESGQIDVALSVARAEAQGRPDWWMPALFTRLRTRRLWSSAAPEQDTLTAEELRRGLGRLEALAPVRGPGLRAALAEAGARLRARLDGGAAPAGDLAAAARELDTFADALLRQSFAQVARGPEPDLTEPACPFRGLAAFRPGDRQFFHARERLVADLLATLRARGFLAILGASGSGKSSLAMAGLAPALADDYRAQGKELALVTLRPGPDPLAALGAAEAEQAPHRLIIVDQFEELFTLGADQATRRAFIGRLLALRGEHPMIMTMRLDFLGDCALHPELTAVMDGATGTIRPMTAHELQIAMERQAVDGGLTLEAGLSQLILEDITGEPGAMPLLQHALQELWRHRYGRWLRIADYFNIGGAKEAIAETARVIYERLPEAERPIVREIFMALTRVDTAPDSQVRRDTRRRVPTAELLLVAGADSAETTRRVIEQLADARLIVKDEREVEIAHEALIRHWPQLSGWLNENRVRLAFERALADAADGWEGAGREVDLLLHRGSRLRLAKSMAAPGRLLHTATIQSYLDACELQEKEEQPLKYLDRVGWALVVNALEDSALVRALWPLVEHRLREMGCPPVAPDFRDGENCQQWMARLTGGFKGKLYDREGGAPPVLLYRPDESAARFLARHGTAVGPPDVARVPYYLLLVGRPGPLDADDELHIPLEFQYQLDVQYGVGRLCFADVAGRHQLDAYARYARTVVACEMGQVTLARRVGLFATRHEDDRSTMRSHDELVIPLLARLKATHKRWTVQAALEQEATHARVARMLGGEETPAVFFSATHGLGLPLSDDRLVLHQGALVCQDWGGLGPLKREQWFAGEDLAEDARLLGSVAFLWSCYSGGTPQHDEFIFDVDARPVPQIAPYSFIAQLPQRLLAHANGGALAVIGHIERQWTFSFSGTEDTRSAIEAYVRCFDRLLNGFPVGAAMEPFNLRYAESAALLAHELALVRSGQQIDNLELTRLWMNLNDARNYIIIGDPAARLPMGPAAGDPPPRPTLAELEAALAGDGRPPAAG